MSVCNPEKYYEKDYDQISQFISRMVAKKSKLKQESKPRPSSEVLTD